MYCKYIIFFLFFVLTIFVSTIYSHAAKTSFLVVVLLFYYFCCVFYLFFLVILIHYITFTHLDVDFSILPANLLLYCFLSPSLSHTICPLSFIFTGFIFCWRCFGCWWHWFRLRMRENSVKWKYEQTIERENEYPTCFNIQNTNYYCTCCLMNK